jgi:hypothetical protein
MSIPTVTEVTPRLEPTGHDTFIDDLRASLQPTPTDRGRER